MFLPVVGQSGHPALLSACFLPVDSLNGSVEKSRQRRSHQFSELTYYPYAPRTKMAAALLNELFWPDPRDE